MKILQANFHTKWGGQAAVVFLLSRALAQRGHEVTVAAPRDSHLARRAADAGLPVFDEAAFLARGWAPGILADSRRLQSLLRAQRFDIVHTNGSPDGWALTAALRSTRLPAVVVRTRHNLKRIRRDPVNRWFYSSATDHVVAVSTAIRRHVLASGICAASQVTVIHPALDLDAFVPGAAPREEMRRELGLDNGQLVVGTSARLEVQKGIDFLLRAFQRIVQRQPQARLVIAGHGKQRQALEALARELGLAGRARFCGFRSDIPAVLAALDVFALTSRTEGFGVALAEAMAVGLPAIATRVDGVMDIVSDGVDGVLVDYGDVAGLADALVRLLRDPDERRRLGAAASRRARAFSPEATAKRHEELYRELLERRKR